MWVNPLDAIKTKQLALAAEGADNPYVSEPDEPERTDVPDKYQHYKEALKADQNQLKQLKTREAKAAAKKTMLKQYTGFVNEYVNLGHCYPNSVAVTVAIWLLDVDDMEAGLNLTLHLIKQGCHHSPNNFDRPLEVFICDTMYDWAAKIYRYRNTDGISAEALKESQKAMLVEDPWLKDTESASPLIDIVVAEMGKGRWSLPVAVESKMFTILAKNKKLSGEYETALQLIEKARQVNPDGHGTKRLQEDVESAMRAQAKG